MASAGSLSIAHSAQRILASGKAFPVPKPGVDEAGFSGLASEVRHRYANYSGWFFDVANRRKDYEDIVDSGLEWLISMEK